MIPNSDLIKKISERLSESEIVSFLPNTSYSFVIYENEGEYKKPIKEANHVTKFINCVASVIEDNKIGINAETMTLSKTMKLDILIPDATVMKDGESFSNYVISFMNSAFNLPYSDNEVYDNMLYNVVGVFSTVTPGTKEIRPSAGESLTVSVFIDWVISALGYSSAEIQLFLGNTRIYYSRLDISRSSTQESNIKSSVALGVQPDISRSSTVGTALVISITKPDRLDPLDEKIHKYLIYGDHTPFAMVLRMPTSIQTNEDNVALNKVLKVFNLEFKDAAKGVEGLNVPVNTCTLIEPFTI